MNQIQREKLTLALSFVAYKGLAETEPGKIHKAIQDGLDILRPDIGEQKIVWGPAVHKLGMEIFTDALMFVVQSADNPSEYTVAIRGTSPLSIGTVLLQDLWVENQVYWDSGNAPEDAKISVGSYLGLHFLQKLRPKRRIPGSKKTIMGFFEEAVRANGGITRINFTGHSLGGTLAATLALWFQDKSHFIWEDKAPEIYSYSYAPLTAGNRAFAGYSNEQLHSRCYRYCNPLDVVPHLFNRRSMKKVPDLYKPRNRMGILIWLAYKWVYHNVKNNTYTQIKQQIEIASKVNPSKWFFCTQLDYQHNDAYVNHLALLMNENKNADEIRDGKSLLKDLRLEGETKRFGKHNMRRIFKKGLRKLKKTAGYIFSKPIHKRRMKLRKRR